MKFTNGSRAGQLSVIFKVIVGAQVRRNLYMIELDSCLKFNVSRDLDGIFLSTALEDFTLHSDE
jgi:hypothetical protein